MLTASSDEKNTAAVPQNVALCPDTSDLLSVCGLHRRTHQDLDSKMLRRVQEFAHAAWPGAKKGRSPVANPVQVSRSRLQYLRKEPYVCAEKTDGIAMVLVWAHFHGWGPCAYFMNRAMEVTVVNTVAAASLFQGEGTVLEGELVLKHSGAVHFLVYDGIRVCGEDLTSSNYLARRSAVRAVLETPDAPVVQNVPVLLKNAYMMSEFPKLLQACEAGLGHESDGLVFTPINCKVMSGSHPYLLKYKHAPSIDLWVCFNPDTKQFEFQAGDHDPIEVTEGASTPGLRERTGGLGFAVDHTTRLQLETCLTWRLVEFDVTGKRWSSQALAQRESWMRAAAPAAPDPNDPCGRPGSAARASCMRFCLQFLRERRDKKTANSLYTALSVLDEVAENVEVADISAIAEKLASGACQRALGLERDVLRITHKKKKSNLNR